MTVLRFFGWRGHGQRRTIKGHKTPNFTHALHKSLNTRAKNRRKRKRKSN